MDGQMKSWPFLCPHVQVPRDDLQRRGRPAPEPGRGQLPHQGEPEAAGHLHPGSEVCFCLHNSLEWCEFSVSLTDGPVHVFENEANEPRQIWVKEVYIS